MSLSTFPRRQLCAFAVAAGGLMHWLGLWTLHRADAFGPWWLVAGLGFFGAVYPPAAWAILKRKRAGLWAAFLGPLLGSTLILAGILFPDTGLMGFIPGTLGRELTLIGFLTLVAEPVGVVLAAELLFGGKR